MHFRDPIHGTIALSPDELALVESPVFQRLRGIRQLGFGDQAFPGATHTRFAHSLGAMQMASRMFDAVFAPGDEGVLPEGERRRLRQLVRLAVLLHDLGHAPLSHATEDCMPPRRALGLDCFTAAEQLERATHEDYTVLLLLASPLRQTLEQRFAPLGLGAHDVAQLISPRFAARAASLVVSGIDFAPLLAQIVSGELDADRMDYLQRDSFYAGVNYGKFDEQWLLSNLTLHVEDARAHLALAHRAIFAFEDFLLSRYHMFVSVYYHHTAVGFDTMLGRFIEEEPQAFALPTDAERYVACDDITLWTILRASPNPWARRVVARDLYRRLLELHTADGAAEIAALQDALRHAAVDFFISRDEGVLSRYYGAGRQPPIFVINRALQRVSRIEEYSPLFERYAQPARLTRVYVRPDQVAAARACLTTALPPTMGEQLRLAWK
ncbi:MAG: HD domain-containing protein [Proteobacteria bacterium]|nr:HD domain-containing protein [Pseudomonadota bacterium]